MSILLILTGFVYLLGLPLGWQFFKLGPVLSVLIALTTLCAQLTILWIFHGLSTQAISLKSSDASSILYQDVQRRRIHHYLLVILFTTPFLVVWFSQSLHLTTHWNFEHRLAVLACLVLIGIAWTVASNKIFSLRHVVTDRGIWIQVQCYYWFFDFQDIESVWRRPGFHFVVFDAYRRPVSRWRDHVVVLLKGGWIGRRLVLSPKDPELFLAIVQRHICKEHKDVKS